MCLAEAGLLKSEGSQSIVYKPSACLCCEVLCGVTAFVWNKYPCCCFRHPCVLSRLQTTYHLKHSNLEQISTYTTDNKSLIDHIFTNITHFNIQAGVLETYFTDHKAVWATFHNFTSS